MSNSNIALGSIALSKMVLHAARYSHLAVNGILLGTIATGNSSDVEIIDAVPLFHHTLALAPMLDVALTQVSALPSMQDIALMLSAFSKAYNTASFDVY